MQKSPTELINLVFSGLMVLITLTGFIVFFFTDYLTDRAYGTKSYILGTIFLAYAIYRTFRMYNMIKPKQSIE